MSPSRNSMQRILFFLPALAALLVLPTEAFAQASLPALTSSPGPGGSTNWSLPIQTL
ncbi:MAG: hypothetical protein QG572_255, partial [Pseudomonadota bacterium]|nr:hypothetical protein [Pseudomonadota bacterium]